MIHIAKLITNVIINAIQQMSQICSVFGILNSWVIIPRKPEAINKTKLDTNILKNIEEIDMMINLA